MILSGGDVVQYKELNKCTVGEYLIKLDNFVSKIEQTEKQSNAVKNPSLLRKR